MPLSFLPTVMADAVTRLTPAYLQSRGIRLLMLDFDNTIVPYTTSAPTPEMEAWLQQMKTSPIEICVVSNSRKDRVKIFCDGYGIPCLTHARKPSAKKVRACMAQYGFPPESCALAGDQIFTDTLAANSAGCTAILVHAIHNHNFWLKLRHAAELPFIFFARKRRMDYEKY